MLSERRLKGVEMNYLDGKSYKASSPAQERARKRNFAKYQLAGVHSRLRGICGASEHLSTNFTLLKEERVALNLVSRDIRTILSHWEENYIELKRRENV